MHSTTRLNPELEEKERTVASSHGLKGKAEAGISGSKIDVEAEKGTAAKSTFTRSEFSHERKCVEVMKYVTDEWPDNYYSNADDWYNTRSLKNLVNLTVDTEPNGVRVESEPVPPASREEQEKELKEELQGLN